MMYNTLDLCSIPVLTRILFRQRGSQIDINLRIVSCMAAIINNVGDFQFGPRPGWCHGRFVLVIHEIVGRKEEEAQMRLCG